MLHTFRKATVSIVLLLYYYFSNPMTMMLCANRLCQGSRGIGGMRLGRTLVGKPPGKADAARSASMWRKSRSHVPLTEHAQSRLNDFGSFVNVYHGTSVFVIGIVLGFGYHLHNQALDDMKSLKENFKQDFKDFKQDFKQEFAKQSDIKDLRDLITSQKGRRFF
mmetsp:Transcript_17289/g.40760  ORF Transcript_17289/g.40760 Transcript_17289/m.40760 type:complete len:164 (+) Transcript_17289:3-494(+)